MGTGTIASGDQTQEACHFLRNWVKENISEEASEQVRICYGASITETNVENLVRLADVDGFLVGSTSTKPIFRTIFDLVNKHVKQDFEKSGARMWIQSNEEGTTQIWSTYYLASYKSIDGCLVTKYNSIADREKAWNALDSGKTIARFTTRV